MGRIVIIFILLIVVTDTYAQKLQKVTATYTYYAPDNVSLEDAKRKALDRAKISAIADVFGTLVTQSNSTIITNQNGQSNSRFLSFGSSEVKGEWIETIEEPKYDIRYESDMLVVYVEVTGRIREILNVDIEFTAKILRNGTDEKYESNEFRSGDDMYLYFKSPVDGYLAVYLLNEDTQEVFCLLPYKASGEGTYHIEHDKIYILFSAKNEKNNPSIVDEYTMTCSGETEVNDVYVIFSPNAFVKANSDGSINELLPRQLSFVDFQKWLVKNKKRDVEMKHVCVGIRISKS